MATASSSSSSTSSALTEVVAQPRIKTRRTISPYDLTSSDNPVKSNLLSRVPLLSLDKAYNALTLDEEAKNLSRDNDGRVDGVSFAVQTNPPRKPYDNRAVCSICGRTGHIADNCFHKIGYPEWWGENTKSSSNYRGKTGNNAGKGGAGRGTTTTSVGSMTGKNFNSAHVNNVSTHFGLTTSSSQNSPLTPVDRVGISGLSNDQWNTLVNILEERKSRSNDLKSEFPLTVAAPSSPPLQSLSSQSPSFNDIDFMADHDQFNDSSHEPPVTSSSSSPQVNSTPSASPPKDLSVNPIQTEHDSVSQPAEKETVTVTVPADKIIVQNSDSSSVTPIHRTESPKEKAPDSDETVSSSTSPNEDTAPEPEKLGFGFRKKTPPIRLADYVTSLVYTPLPSNTPYPIDNFVSSSQFSDKYQAFLLAITSGPDLVARASKASLCEDQEPKRLVPNSNAFDIHLLVRPMRRTSYFLYFSENFFKELLLQPESVLSTKFLKLSDFLTLSG
ncbi:unnamed protein product [Arabidopsis halleri]